MRSIPTYIFLLLTCNILYSNDLAFIEEKGQLGIEDNSVRYYYESAELSIYLRSNGFSFVRKRADNASIKIYRHDVDLINSNLDPFISPKNELNEKINFYNTNSNAITGVSKYQEIIFKNIYDRIDLKYYFCKNGEFEYDFIVRSNADPDQIKFKDDLLSSELENGSLKFTNPMFSINNSKPFSYQGANEIRSNYSLNNGIISFEIGEYDKNKTLVIDPVSVVWDSYYAGTCPSGGPSDLFYSFVSVKFNSDGELYALGVAEYVDGISTPGAHQVDQDGIRDLMIVKFDVDGNRLWSTFIGGNQRDQVNAISLDEDGNCYLLLETESANLASPRFSGEFSNGNINTIISLFNSSGDQDWARYFNCESDLFPTDLLFYDDNIYISALSSCSDLALNGEMNNNSLTGDNSIITKMSSDASFIWTSYYAGSNN